MRAIFESGFEIFYLITVIAVGVRMILRSGDSRQFRLFGVMATVLGCGDAFHLVPRIIGLCTTGLQDYTVSLGIGKLITSITMTIFYVILYRMAVVRYENENKGVSVALYVLASVRIILCLFPQNQWTVAAPPLSWGIYRNIPFAVLGLLMIAYFFRQAKAHQDKAFRWMWLAILLSFGFYIPVVLWAGTVPVVGMLMIPKTCAYLWMVVRGWGTMKKELK